MKPYISVIIPVYNVEKYLPRFIGSLRAQTFTNFEALFIDDASGDGSATALEGAASGDARITLLRHPGRLGAGAARNTGIRAASGTTLCFADPDDLLPETSLELRYAAFAAHDAVVRACHEEVSRAGTVIRRDERPEEPPPVFRPRDVARECGIDHFLNGHWTWLFPTALIRDKGIFNGENMRTAEDIMLLARLFFHVERMVWLPDVAYRWVKRDDSLSTTPYTAEHYADYFDCCDALYEEAQKRDAPVLGDMFCDGYLARYLYHFMRQYTAGHSSEEDARKVVGHAARICAKHGALQRFRDAAGQEDARYPGLFMLWNALNDQSPTMLERLINAQNAAVRRHYSEVRRPGGQGPVCFDRLDRARGLLRARYTFCGNPPEERFTHAGRAVKPAFVKNRLEFQGPDFTVFERILWLPIPGGGDGLLELRLNGEDAGLNAAPDQLRAAFKPAALDERGFPPDILALRRLAKSEAMRKMFKNAWLFLDKDSQADDNAEHLCRWVMRNHPELNVWFALSRDSHDWDRLSEEGFRLVPHGSMEHKVLFTLCENLVSSQMDSYVFSLVDERYIADLRETRFVCLPHGVTKDNVSRWFNSVPFDVFVTATYAERDSLVADGGPYVMTAREVRLGGFPRYDKWLEPSRREDVVFVMPTWRGNLVGAWDGKGQRRERNEDFLSSPYVRTWRDVFEDKALKETLDRHGYRIVFFAHPCFEEYLDALPFPAFVEKRSKAQGSIIEAMRASRLLITDFSSVAYDMAYMGRPVIYYQTESKDSFLKSHGWSNGYIDYETMGFGPVCRDRAGLLAALESALREGCVVRQPYADRAGGAFAYRDAACCERAFSFVAEASKPYDFAYAE